MQSTSALRLVSSCVPALAAALLAACGAPPESGEGGDEPVGSMTEGVQLAYGNRLHLDANAFKARISGVIRYAWSSTISVSCGATFISPHFAITAAHCVPQDRLVVDNNDTFNAGDQTFVVQQVNVDDLVNRAAAGDPSVTAAFSASTTVTGTWPDYTQPNPMGCNNGYCLTAHYSQCRVRRRCSSTFGMHNCPTSISSRNGGAGADIALIHCADRPQISPYGTVYPDNEFFFGMPIDVHWYHEIAALSTQPNDGIGPAGNFDHYARYDGSNTGAFGKDKNYHYRKGSSLQFFPIVSKQFPNGAAYRTVPPPTGQPLGDVMWTDAFGCHGTSGGGVFNSGTDYRLLGPVTVGGAAMSGRLCVNTSLASAGPGNPIVGYVRPVVTRMLETFVLADR
jgi:hypothetical protein